MNFRMRLDRLGCLINKWHNLTLIIILFNSKLKLFKIQEIFNPHSKEFFTTILHQNIIEYFAAFSLYS